MLKAGKTLSFLILACCITACMKQKQTNTETDLENNNVVIDSAITNISVLYYNYMFESNEPMLPQKMKLNVPDFNINSKGVLNAEIKDSTTIDKFKMLLKGLKEDKNNRAVDTRIVAVVNYNYKSPDTLVIGGRYVNEIFFNGIQQQANNKFLFFVKNSIGFYPWIIGDGMFSMEELQDPSFPKDPFVSSDYYKEYQKALLNR